MLCARVMRGISSIESSVAPVAATSPNRLGRAERIGEADDRLALRAATRRPASRAPAARCRRSSNTRRGRRSARPARVGVVGKAGRRAGARFDDHLERRPSSARAGPPESPRHGSRRPGETRVAVIPAGAAALKKAGVDVAVETGAQPPGLPTTPTASRARPSSADRDLRRRRCPPDGACDADRRSTAQGQALIGFADPLGAPEAIHRGRRDAARRCCRWS